MCRECCQQGAEMICSWGRQTSPNQTPGGPQEGVGLVQVWLPSVAALVVGTLPQCHGPGTCPGCPALCPPPPPALLLSQRTLSGLAHNTTFCQATLVDFKCAPDERLHNKSLLFGLFMKVCYDL